MAPDCERHSSPERLPLSSGSSAGLRAGANGDHLRPFGARRFDAPKWVDGELKKTDPKLLLEAPLTTPVSRLDEGRAARELVLHWGGSARPEPAGRREMTSRA